MVARACLRIEIGSLVGSFGCSTRPVKVFVDSVTSLSAFRPRTGPSLTNSGVFVGSRGLHGGRVGEVVKGTASLTTGTCQGQVKERFGDPHGSLNCARGFLFVLSYLKRIGCEARPILISTLSGLFVVRTRRRVGYSAATVQLVDSSLISPCDTITKTTTTLCNPLRNKTGRTIVRVLRRVNTVRRVPTCLRRIGQQRGGLVKFNRQMCGGCSPQTGLIQSVLCHMFRIYKQRPLVRMTITLRRTTLSSTCFMSHELCPGISFCAKLVCGTVKFPPSFFPLLFAVPHVTN